MIFLDIFFSFSPSLPLSLSAADALSRSQANGADDV